MNKEIELKENDFIVSKTDLKGKITYCNNTFLKISGYEIEELIGAPHNILRHEDMPKLAYKVLWSKIKENNDFFGFVKNKTKNGDFYWVFTYVSADLDKNGKIIGYTSIRRQIRREAIEIMEPIYKKLIELEKVSINKSEEFLTDTLNSLDLEYNQFILLTQTGA